MKNNLNKVRNIFWLYKPYWKYSKPYVILTLLFWIIAVPMARILAVIFPAQVMGALDSGASWGKILLLVIGFQCAIAFIPLVEDIYMYFLKNIANVKIDLKIKRGVYLQVLKTDYKYIDDPEYYDKYKWAIDQHSANSAEAFSLINQTISAIVVIVSLIGIVAANNLIVVLLCFVSMIIRLYAAFQYNKADLKMEDEIVPVDRRLEYTRRIFYLKNYSADLKSTGLRNYIFKNYDKMSGKKISILKKSGLKFFLWSALGDIVYRVIMIAIILIIAYNIYTGNIIGSATYMTIMLSIEKLDEYLYDLFEMIKSGDRLGMHGEKIREFFSVISKIETNESSQNTKPTSGAFSVEFKNAFFTYPNSDFKINNFNLYINPGEKVAIVGRNGVGKSTLVKLLMRFYDVDNGSIRINGIDIKSYDVNELRSRIGAAFQNSNIYAMSFSDNIGLYGSADDNTLEYIVKKTGLSSVLEKNHADITTEVTKEFDENGIELSGGEIQKMAIARLFTRDFGLLIFDEPSSALDPLSEYEMTKLILDGSNLTTTIIVAHRLSTIRNVDRIIVVDNGSIKETGTHDELMLLHGEYYEMFTKQAENYLDNAKNPST